jgi:hypothetical protein
MGITNYIGPYNNNNRGTGALGPPLYFYTQTLCFLLDAHFMHVFSHAAQAIVGPIRE